MTFSHQACLHYLKGLQAKLYVESLEIIFVPTELYVNHIFDQKKNASKAIGGSPIDYLGTEMLAVRFFPLSFIRKK